MQRSPFRSLALVIGLAAACARISAEESPPPPAEQAPVTAEIGKHEAKAVIATPNISDEAKAYLADCHHTFKKKQDEGEELMDECLWRAFDQNCAPDPSGCWDQGQACRDACGQPCASCDDACGDGCDGCIAKCNASDGECKARCAEERVGCRNACLDTRDKCADKDCAAAEEKCNSDHLALREQKCPRCSEISECMSRAIEKDQDPAGTCSRKFKREPKECFEWCFEW